MPTRMISRSAFLSRNQLTQPLRCVSAASRTGAQPAGTLTAGTTQTTLRLTTDENATCRYGTVSGTAYGSLPATFASTGGTAHASTIAALTNGASYAFYVRCADAAGNPNLD